MIPKQDKTYSRKASDIEQKYDLGAIGKGGGGDSVKVSQLEQTLSQHINETSIKFEEIDKELENLGDVNAEGVGYDNTSSSLTAENVQGAIDELSANAKKKVDKTIEYYGDMNALVTSGFYRVGTNANLPSGYEYGQVIVSRGSDTATQIACSFHLGTIITRSCSSPDSNPKWTGWVDYATKKDIEDIEVAGGFDLSYEAENEALTLISSSENESPWNLLAEKTGTTGVITLPTSFSELHILIGFTNYMYTFDILADYLSDTATSFRDGYCISSSVYGDAYLSVTNKQISAWTVRKEGVTQTATVRVYYR